MKKLKVLFTGGGGAGTELLFNQLNDRYDLHFADASSDMDVISDVVPFDRKHKIPLAEAKEFVEEVRDLVIRLKSM